MSIHGTTPCKNCVFAEFNGRTQIDCSAKLLDKHRAAGRPVVEVFDEEKDEFFVINGGCHWFRNNRTWSKVYEIMDIEGLVAEARKEQILKADAIIYIGDGETMEMVEETASSLEKQKLRFNTIIFCLDTEYIRAAQLRLWASQNLHQRWKTEKIVEEGKSRFRSIDIAVGNIKSPFYSLFIAGYRVHPEYLSKLDTLINDEVANIMMVTPDGDNGLFISKKLHDKVDGNHQYQVEHKIEHLCEEAKCLQKILSMSQLLI